MNAADEYCPECHAPVGVPHHEDCHVGWAEHLKDVPPTPGLGRNLYLQLMKGDGDDDADSVQPDTV